MLPPPSQIIGGGGPGPPWPPSSYAYAVYKRYKKRVIPLSTGSWHSMRPGLKVTSHKAEKVTLLLTSYGCLFT